MVAGLPPGVEAVRRGQTLVLLNHNAEAVSVPLPADAGSAAVGSPAGLELPAFGVLLRDIPRDSPQ